MAKKEIEQFDDEIDLFELIESLWKEKVLIVAITAFITLIGLGYVLLTPSTYEARVEILPPSISNIAELKKFDILKSSNIQIQTNKVYKEFLSILGSNQLRERLEQEVMESFTIKLDTTKRSQEHKASLTLQSNNADLVAKFANQMVELAIEQYRINISLAFDSEKDQKIKYLDNKKNSLIAAYSRRLDQEIAKLEEAYLISKKLDIIEPRELKYQSQTVNIKDKNTSIKGGKSITEEIRYLYSYGARALIEEIETIDKRKKNLSMASGLTDIEQELSLLNITSFDASKINPVIIDLAAEAPELHVKPKSTWIVILSVVIGGFLAIIFVLIRNAVRNRKSHS